MAPVASSPAVGDVDGDGIPEVVVGTGAHGGTSGGITIFNRNGTTRCSLATRPDKSGRAVFNAPAIGDVNGDGVNDVVYGAWDHLVYVTSGQCGVMGTFDHLETSEGLPGAPRVKVRGFSLWGRVAVKRKKRRTHDVDEGS